MAQSGRTTAARRVDWSDARAARTRAKLLAAFHEIVQQVDPSEMTVSALTRAAGVNRTSFYEHFASPEDVAVYALGELLDVVRDADLARREQGLSGLAASRAALREIVDFVWARRASYARLLGPAAPPGTAQAVTEAYTSHAVEALRAIPGRPADADPLVTAQFLAGGVLNVVGLWLAAPRGRWSRERLVDALVATLPAWLITE